MDLLLSRVDVASVAAHPLKGGVLPRHSRCGNGVASCHSGKLPSERAFVAVAATCHRLATAHATVQESNVATVGRSLPMVAFDPEASRCHALPQGCHTAIGEVFCHG